MTILARPLNCMNECRPLNLGVLALTLLWQESPANPRGHAQVKASGESGMHVAPLRHVARAHAPPPQSSMSIPYRASPGKIENFEKRFVYPSFYGLCRILQFYYRLRRIITRGGIQNHWQPPPLPTAYTGGPICSYELSFCCLLE